MLQLLGLLLILQDESVDVSLAADLELDLGGLLATLYAGRCILISPCPSNIFNCPVRNPFPASNPNSIFLNFVEQLVCGGKHTRSILASANLNELFSQLSAKKSSSELIITANLPTLERYQLTFLISEISLGILAVF